MIENYRELLTELRAIHEAIREAVVKACEESAIEQLSAVVAEDDAGDTIFAIDRVSEEILLQHFERLAQRWPCLLVAEGLGATGKKILPEGNDLSQVKIVVIVDPIDGTRGLMYQKRPAWILTGAAPYRGDETNLTDIELALQTEIPLLKQHLSDTLWAIQGGEVGGERYNRLDGTRQPLKPRPSRATTIAQGYGNISRFFPGTRGELAQVDDELVEKILGPVEAGKAQSFEDQYICSGGQFYELIMGHDRWLADLRPVVEPLLQKRGKTLGICCHPYDVCTELIAREAGVIITNEFGKPLATKLEVDAPVAWIGYANPTIQGQVAPVLHALLVERGLDAGLE
ncbi:MAG: inositol monophosphatase [Chloroflexi bacterium]|nr:inositol monophosphatase [Chloroflexota bacterium]OJV99261.1 MAG: inositol monophosphatase [Chloroflexi bacterium 54-19]